MEQTYKTRFGYCHINRDVIELTISEVANEIAIYPILKIVVKTLLFLTIPIFIAYDIVERIDIDEYYKMVIYGFCGLAVLLDGISNLRKWKYFLGKTILRNSITEISLRGKNEISIVYLNEKNKVQKENLKCDTEETKMAIYESLSHPNGS